MKKILILLISCMMLFSCTKENKPSSLEEDGAATYINLIKNYETREKNINNTVDNEKFDEFLEQTFIDSMNSDFMNMHFSVIDYKSYNIDKPPVDLGEVSYEFDQESFDFFKEQLQQLQEFDYNSLSYRQQYDYEALEYSLYETLADYFYYRYNFILSSNTCVPENVVSNFVDYTFYDQESVDDYITCLADIDRFFDDVLKYTEDQANDGLPLADVWIDYTKEACDGAANKKEDNEFIVSFDDRINQLEFLTDLQKQEYKQKNKEIVLNEVIPAYEKVSKEIEKYRNKAKLEDYMLYKFDKDYAELTYLLYSSCNKDMDTLFQELKDTLSYLEAEYISCVYDEQSLDNYYEGLDGGYNFNLVGKECLEFLKDNLNAYYPDLGEVEYSVQELDPDTAPASAIAYYWPSPIDDFNQNIIRTNPNNMMEGYSTYSTLSHEGFPGHLYQHVYYQKTNPHNFRKTIGFIGYTEGWAVNAQYYASQFSGIADHFAASALFTEESYYFLMYSIIDIGVNYYGWKANDIVAYFEEESVLFNFNTSLAEEITKVLIEYAGTYISYGVGFSNFFVLEQKTKDALGIKFDYHKYHDTLLKNGPLPFNILETAVQEYIDENK